MSNTPAPVTATDEPLDVLTDSSAPTGIDYAPIIDIIDSICIYLPFSS